MGGQKKGGGQKNFSWGVVRKFFDPPEGKPWMRSRENSKMRENFML